jgi:hypothetical protein
MELGCDSDEFINVINVPFLYGACPLTMNPVALVAPSSEQPDGGK